MSAESGWAKVLLGGLGVAAITFVADHAWERMSYRELGPDYVHVAVRTEDGAVLFYVRNESHQPLDLVSADLQITLPTDDESLGAYPTPSRLYEVQAAPGAKLEQQGEQLLVQIPLAQAIEPGAVDQFGLKILSSTGALTPTVGSIDGIMSDLKGNTYSIHY